MVMKTRPCISIRTLLYRHSELFDHHPEHLWNVAEIYLGNNKIYVAKSYYMSLIEKFPGTEFSKYALQRIEDIESLQAIDSGNLDLLPKLAEKLSNIDNYGCRARSRKTYS